ncbi:hypothetical protein [Streptomyces stramineus]|uniref:hypothetical protein n=1 Tax=Streptomyces stramineus TaxID=173861 RepID=UPI0031CE9717
MPSLTVHALAGADPCRFLAADSVDVVQLPSVASPQSVLAYVQHAAAAPGPLLVWVTGRLMVPARRGGEPHLALRESTPGTVRYTGLPWSWLTRTLRGRTGPTLLLTDTEADAAAWPHVTAAVRAGHFDGGVPVHGVIAPAATAPQTEAGGYTSAFLAALRAGEPGAGPAVDATLMHERALAQAGLGGDVIAVCHGAPGPVLANQARHTRPALVVTTGPVPVAAAPLPVTVPTVPVTAPRPPRATAATSVPAPATATAPAPAAPVVPSQGDVLEDVLAAARAGRHNEAAAMAAAWEQQALRRHGPASPEAGLWTEVRADLARLAGDHARAAELWMTAAHARLARSGPADEETLAAVKRAHYCWQHSQDQAPRLAPALLDLWEQVPGGAGAADHIRARLNSCQDAPPAATR